MAHAACCTLLVYACMLHNAKRGSATPCTRLQGMVEITPAYKLLHHSTLVP